MTAEIGARVREGLRRVHMTQRELASAVGMTEDAMSNALNQKRSFAAAELAQIAPLIHTSVDWLITGAHGRYEPKLSARHAYSEGHGHTEHDWSQAKEAVADVVLAYQQVGFEGTSVAATEHKAAADAAREARQRLEDAAGDRFVDDLPSAIEAAFGIHVFILGPRETPSASGLRIFSPSDLDRDHAYAGEVNGQQFIVVSSGGAWYRKNFALAHELAHLLAGDPRHVDRAGDARFDEIWANAFASELLMPARVLRQVKWVGGIEEPEAVHWLLKLGVSTQALQIAVSTKARVRVDVLDLATIPLVRRHAPDRFVELDRQYRTPRFPKALVEAHERSVDEAGLAPGVLAWMLGVPVEELRPATSEGGDASVDELAEALGLA